MISGLSEEKLVLSAWRERGFRQARSKRPSCPPVDPNFAVVYREGYRAGARPQRVES